MDDETVMRRVTVLEARLNAILPHLATKADLETRLNATRAEFYERQRNLSASPTVGSMSEPPNWELIRFKTNLWFAGIVIFQVVAATGFMAFMLRDRLF